MSTYPTVQPSITLDFQKSKQLDPRIAFSRSSAATYVEGGLVKNAYTDQARFEEDKGLLIEESRTNLIPNSQVFQTGFILGAFTSVDNAAVAPDGTTTAASILETAATTGHYVQLSSTSQNNLSQSIFVKPAGRDNICVRFVTSGNDWYTITFNLTGNGSITQEVPSTSSNWNINSKSITPLSNGWYRISVGATTSAATTYIFSILGCDSSTPTLVSQYGFPSYTGDITKGYYVWGGQVEANTFPTSYIPTAGSTVTRAPDQAILSGTNVTSWYNITEGTVCSKAMSPLDLTTSRLVWHFRDPGRKEHNADNGFQWYDIGTGYSTNGFTYVAGVFNKQAYAYSSVVGSSTRACLNGTFLYDKTVDPNITPSAHTTLSLGSNVGVNLFVNGYIQRFSYYTRRLTDAELQTITS